MSQLESDDLQSFFDELGDIKPLKENDKVYSHSPAEALAKKQRRAAAQQVSNKAYNPLSMEGVQPIKPDDFLDYQQPGIQDGVFKKLRMGKYEIEHRISLKGLTLAESRDTFYSSLRQCHERGVRAILVQHGKGENSQPFPALKKSYVKHWLGELEDVIAFHTAQPQHGGLRATYVLLKKHPQQKLINREKNRRR
ncbi:DNA endonuclease SmrA [Alteromonas pelagimontana]|uniref:DNA endonuclease SmrA n=1 Tax=Alteromonas pelagimontana TaxID=1858656 RepID=A0A6M4MGT1_9ALTE|nr:DNA endonuclease SmrA [Alteromonas pelagimontana]QJR81795.1 DNA endonuclease SmrA [Alteromonas pelagimontana]